MKIQYSNISCPSCSENMLLGWFIGVTIPFRLGLGSSQHGTQLRIANGIKNGPSPLLKATKCQNTVTEKKPLQHGVESVANVIQKSKRNKSYPRMLTSCAATVTLQWGTWKEPAGSLLLCPTDGQFYWPPSQKSWVSTAPILHSQQGFPLRPLLAVGCADLDNCPAGSTVRGINQCGKRNNQENINKNQLLKERAAARQS